MGWWVGGDGRWGGGVVSWWGDGVVLVVVAAARRVLSVLAWVPTFFVVRVGLDEGRLDVVLDLGKRAEPFGKGWE